MIDADVVPVRVGYPYVGTVELWNPSIEDVSNILKFLDNSRKVLFIWVYGDPYSVPDFSNICHDRVVQPIWLGKTREEALEVRDQVFKLWTEPVFEQEIVYKEFKL